MDHVLARTLVELRERLPEWYPDLPASVEPRVIHVETRPVGQIVRLHIQRSDHAPVDLVVKIPTEPPASTAEDRPRLSPVTAPRARCAFEFSALRLIEERLADVSDPSLRSVRALGILPESSALIMEAFPGRPFHKLLVQGAMTRTAELRPSALANLAGRWLRVLHDMPTADRPVRQGTRAELIADFQDVAGFVAERASGRVFDDVAMAGLEALTSLPERLPTVISHADFAPRNILVDAHGRVAVIDLLARWQAPPYEDLAGFLVALRTSRANATTRGLLFGRALDRLEPAFLSGYFGSEPIPRTAIRAYELLLVLDKWSARTTRSSATGPVDRLRARLIDGHFESLSSGLARDLRRAG